VPVDTQKKGRSLESCGPGNLKQLIAL
jgi:hypothetical protein